MGIIEQKLEEELKILKFKEDYKKYVLATAVDVISEERQRDSLYLPQ